MRSLTSLVTQFTHQWPGEEVWTGMRSHGRRGIPTEMEIRTLHRTGTENIVTTMGSAFSLLHFHSQDIIFDYSQFLCTKYSPGYRPKTVTCMLVIKQCAYVGQLFSFPLCSSYITQ